MKRKITALCLVVALLAVAVVGGTMAYFTDVDTATNVFTVGSVEINLYETDANGQKVDNLNFNDVVPNKKYDKDPTIENIGKNNAYARLKVTVSDAAAFMSILGDGYQLEDIFGGYNNADWTCTEKGTIDTATDTITYTFTYTANNGILAPNTSSTLFKTVTLPATMTSAQAAALGDDFSIVVKGEAIQADGFISVTEAFGAFDSQHTPTNVSPADKASFVSAVSYIDAGDNITLTLGSDVQLETGELIEVPEGATLNADLNEETLSANTPKSEGPVISNSGTLTLSNGTVSSTGANGGSVVTNSGTLTLNGGTYIGAPQSGESWPSYAFNNNGGTMTVTGAAINSTHGAIASYNDGVVVLENAEVTMSGIPGFTSHTIYTYGGGKVIVNSGTYKNTATDQNAMGSSVINGNVEINGGIFYGRIENYYGTPVIKGGTFDHDPTKFVDTTKYAVTESNGMWTVTAK